jgi:hypothetical protein
MNTTLLTALGLLLIATSLTLMVFSTRSWVVALAQGFGIQSLIGAAASAFYVGYMMESQVPRPITERVQFAIQGIPFHAVGWSGRTAYNSAMIGPAGPPALHLDQFLPIAAIQMSFLAAVIAFRKTRPSEGTDLFLILIVLAVMANTAANVMVRWWG